MSKKLLIASTALTMAVAGASFAKFEAKINGDYKNGIAYVTSSTHQGGEEFQSYQDYEFNINSKYEMDNGITAFFKLEFEADSEANTGTFDDVETGFSGDFGLVRFGSFSADDAYSSVAPTEKGIFSNLGYNSSYSIKGAGASLPSVGLNIGSDENAVMYVTPSIAGFKAVARYTFSDSQVANSAGTNEAGEIQNQQIGLGYKGSFGDAKVAAGGYYSNATGGGTNTAKTNMGDGGQEWMVSVNAEMSGAGLTFMYADFEGESGNGSTTTEETSYSINPYYKTGPWMLNAAYAVEDTDNGSKETGMSLGASYAMGPGVTLGIEAMTAETDSGTVGTDDTDATQVTAGFIFKF